MHNAASCTPVQSLQMYWISGETTDVKQLQMTQYANVGLPDIIESLHFHHFYLQRTAMWVQLAGCNTTNCPPPWSGQCAACFGAAQCPLRPPQATLCCLTSCSFGHQVVQHIVGTFGGFSCCTDAIILGLWDAFCPGPHFLFLWSSGCRLAGGETLHRLTC